MKKLLLFLLLIPCLSNATITPVFTCGFEEGVFATVGDHWLTATTLSYSTSIKRSGDRSLRSLTSAQASNYAGSLTNVATTSTIVTRFYVRFETALPTANVQLMGAYSVGGVCLGTAIFKNSDSKIYAGANTSSFGATGVTVTTGVWYRIDVSANTTSSQIVDVQVDGVACGQYTSGTVVTATNIRPTLQAFSYTSDIYFDDFILSTTLADYPIGAGHVNHFVPTADGTHNVAGANDFEIGTGGVDITNSTTTAWQLLDDIPLQSGAIGTTDFINLVAPPGATDYVEVIFGPATGISTPTVAPRCVTVIVGYAESAAGVENLRLAINDNGTTSDVINIDPANGGTTINYNTLSYSDPPSAASVWTLSGNGNFNNLRMRCYTSDAAPDPYFSGTMIEAEFVDDIATVPGTPSDKRHTTLGVGLIAFSNLKNKKNEESFIGFNNWSVGDIWVQGQRKKIIRNR